MIDSKKMRNFVGQWQASNDKYFVRKLWKNFLQLCENNCFKKYLRLPNHTTAIIPFINCFYCIWKRPKSLYPQPKRSWVYDIKHLSNCIFVSNKIVVNAQIHVCCRFCSSCRDVVNKIARTIIHAITVGFTHSAYIRPCLYNYKTMEILCDWNSKWFDVKFMQS